MSYYKLTFTINGDPTVDTLELSGTCERDVINQMHRETDDTYHLISVKLMFY